MNSQNVLAKKALEACRNQLFFANRFLEQALFRLRWDEEGAIYFGSDGSRLCYSVDYILERYMQTPQQVMMDYLHTVVHCLYQHPFFAAKEQSDYWDLASDIAVECVMEEIDVGHYGISSDTAEEQFKHEVIRRIKTEINMMSAHKIFIFLIKNMTSDKEFLDFFSVDYTKLCALFKRDEHKLWYLHEPSQNGKPQDEKSQNEELKDSKDKDGKFQNEELKDKKDKDGKFQNEEFQDKKDKDGKFQNEEFKDKKKQDGKFQNEEFQYKKDKDGKFQNEEFKDKKKQDDKSQNEEFQDKKKQDSKFYVGKQQSDGAGIDNGYGLNYTMAGGQGMQTKRTQLQQMWEGVAEQVLMASQTFGGRARGDMSGNMVKTLQNLTRENYDYSNFLLKFAVRMEERMQTNPDEFDYIFYTYGLSIDKRMPLIEPLEYKDKYLLREFVIAIDTSGSCAGELVEKFLVKTYNILRQTESFTSKVNIHIIQCDAVIQEDVVIRSQKDLENYISHLTLKGFGGTDFRPVFHYIEQMMEKGEIRRLEGLLYFTDGYGIFPAKSPKYKTAFVFLEQEENVKVPAWAMRVYLDEGVLA